ncbi:MAG: DUF1206 domain-containing protein [Pseudonocardia sp.]
MDTDDVRDAGEDVRDAADSKPVRMVGRVGLVAYGLVHLLLAWLAAQVALGAGDRADKSGALKTLAANGGGRALLWVITIGLVALVVWQLTEAIWGGRNVRPTWRKVLRRVASGGEALLFGLLASTAGGLAAGGSGTSDAEQAGGTATVLAWPGGPLILGALGAGVLVAGGFFVYRGVTRSFLRHLDLAGARPETRSLVTRAGQLGWPALGVVYGIFGMLVIIAAVRYDPARATGLDQALKTLAAQPFGPYLLLAVASGLFCFGVYCLMDARYRAA